MSPKYVPRCADFHNITLSFFFIYGWRYQTANTSSLEGIPTEGAIHSAALLQVLLGEHTFPLALITESQN